MSKITGRHLVRLQEKLKVTEKENIYILGKLPLYFHVFQFTSHQTI